MWSYSFRILHDALRPLLDRLRGSSKKKDDQPYVRPKKLKKVSFYSHLSANQIQVYQNYIDRAFEMSPTLEFRGNDSQLHGLLTDAVKNHSISKLDFEVMRLQYVYADELLRLRHRSRWVEIVINRKENYFFPDPWTIVAGVFTASRSRTSVRNEVDKVARSVN